MTGKRSAPSASGTANKPTKKIKRDPKTANDSKSFSIEARKNTIGERHSAASSKEAHKQQKALVQQRKQAKPNSDSIQRAKELWERLRRKSHVPPDERKRLVEELLGLITGHVKDFVFKHDSVRSIQCAVKYSTKEQRKNIAKELKGEYKALAEARYGKFLLAKLLEEGDKETRNMIISEFYGHVKRLINHPEASWILDDAYRKLASREQKAALLREWYGPEFAIFKASSLEGKEGDPITADLKTLLSKNQEKRQPVMQHLWLLIYQLVQKNLTGFTMLHDAMLQYSLAVGVPSPQAYKNRSHEENNAPNEDYETSQNGEKAPKKDHEAPREDNHAAVDFLELLKNDVDAGADLLKNIAFTPSGSRVVCRALALSDAKGRKLMLRAYKGHMGTLACDENGHRVLITAYEVIDDTKMIGKTVFSELLATNLDSVEERRNAIVALGMHQNGRIALLYPLNTIVDPKSKNEEAAFPPKWLVRPGSSTEAIISEIRDLRQATSKKNPVTRRTELAEVLMDPKHAVLLDSVTNRVDILLGSSFGCQFVSEVLLSNTSSKADKRPALEAIIEYLKSNDSSATSQSAKLELGPAVGRFLKRLIQGGKFELIPGSSPESGCAEGHVMFPNPRLRFTGLLWSNLLCQKDVHQRWVDSDANMLLLAMTEADELEFGEDEEQGAEQKGGFLLELRKMKPKLQEVIQSTSSNEAKFRGASLLLKKLEE